MASNKNKVAESEEKNTGSVEVIQYRDVNFPAPSQFYRIGDRAAMVNYGIDNNYPGFLLSLYGESPVHQSIVNNKAAYICGKSVTLSDGSAIKGIFNVNETFDAFLNKVVKDLEIFEAFAVHVRFSPLGVPSSYKFIPAHYVRTNFDRSKFWVCPDWKRYKGARGLLVETFEAYTGNEQAVAKKRFTARTAEENDILQRGAIFFYTAYVPSVELVYPAPRYGAAIRSILTDIEIRKFNLRTIASGFTPKTIITFKRGANLTETQKRKIVGKIKENYTGSEGDQFIIDFANSNGEAAEINQLTPTGWEDAYLALSDAVSGDILFGHSVTSPALFGVKTEGQLGNTTELETSFNIFRKTYVQTRRNDLNGAFRQLFLNTPNDGKDLQFEDDDLFSSDISDTLKMWIHTKNTLKELAGMAPDKDDVDGDKPLYVLQQEYNTTSVAAAGTTPATNTGAAQPVTIVKKKTGQQMIADKSKVDLNAHGLSKADFINLAADDPVPVHFAKISDIAPKIAQWFIDNAAELTGLTVAQLIEKAASNEDTTADQAAAAVNDLITAGVIEKSDDGKISEPKTQTPAGNRSFVAYDFVKRDGVDGDTLIPGSSEMCRAIVESNKYYTGEDIQKFTAIFGFNVFSHGFHPWRQDDGEFVNHCRHEWKPVILQNKNVQNGNSAN